MTPSSWLARTGTFFTGDPSPMAERGAIAVIGLGRFGASLALELSGLGVEVIGIDRDEDVVESMRDQLAFVARADSTEEEALRQLGLDEIGVAVVAIGSDIQASILTASRLIKFGVGKIWAKAISEPHAEILEQLGISQVVSPERDMGKRLAHLIRSNISDFIRVDDDLVMVRMHAPRQSVDRQLGALKLRSTYGVTVVAVKRADTGTWSIVDPQTILYPEDEILVGGNPKAVEKFSYLDPAATPG